MIGKFIGRTSMGFQNGNMYAIRTDIKMIRKVGSAFWENMNCICVYDNNSTAWCPYQSLEALLKNWEIVSL